MVTHSKPSVSIVMPCFNRGRLLGRAVASIMNQSFRNWELILVDDRSTDDTLVVAEALAREDSRIRVFRNTRAKGPSGARNFGVDKARGKYLAYLDSDDEWMDFHLEIMVRHLETYSDQIDIMSANPLRRDLSSGKVVKYDRIEVDESWGSPVGDCFVFDPELSASLHLKGRVLTTQTIVGRTEVLRLVKWNESVGAGEDCLHNTEVCLLRPRIGHVDEYHVTYWIHDSNLSNCSGKKSLRHRTKLAVGFVRYWRALLDRKEWEREDREWIKLKLAREVVWNLGYNCLDAQGKYLWARRCYGTGVSICPMKLAYWKAFFGTYLKRVVIKSGLRF